MSDHSAHDPDPLAGIRLAGRTIRDRNMTGMRIVNSMLDGAQISGRFDRLYVNDVDVAGYVEAELDHRHPERVALRAAHTIDDLRVMWAHIEDLWSATVARARALPTDIGLHTRIDGEWTFVETLRHLVFATDCWVRCAMFDLPDAFHPLGVAHSELENEFVQQLGLRTEEHVSLDRALDLRADRMGLVRGLLAGLTDEQLDTMSVRSPAPDAPEERHEWRECLKVVMNEECEHRRFALRDLAVLESQTLRLVASVNDDPHAAEVLDPGEG